MPLSFGMNRPLESFIRYLSAPARGGGISISMFNKESKTSKYFDKEYFIHYLIIMNYNGNSNCLYRQ